MDTRVSLPDTGSDNSEDSSGPMSNHVVVVDQCVAEDGAATRLGNIANGPFIAYCTCIAI